MVTEFSFLYVLFKLDFIYMCVCVFIRMYICMVSQIEIFNCSVAKFTGLFVCYI
jgi:hypothetical protein